MILSGSKANGIKLFLINVNIYLSVNFSLNVDKSVEKTLFIIFYKNKIIMASLEIHKASVSIFYKDMGTELSPSNIHISIKFTPLFPPAAPFYDLKQT